MRAGQHPAQSVRALKKSIAGYNRSPVRTETAEAMIFSALATSVLIVHAMFVAFVVLMLPCIFLGKVLGWRWVRLLWLRSLHVAGICIVAAQSWAGMICPLTTLEMWLRQQGQQAVYSESFIEHWLQALLYWDFSAVVFIVAYTLLALMDDAAWFLVPPARN